jgi:site-specific recombinase XerC
MSKKSHFRYRDSMTGFLHFCAEKFHLQKLANVGSKHMQAYVDYRRQAGISEKTLKNDLAAIRFFHQFTGSRNVLPDNRELGIEKTPQGGKDRAWTDEEHRLMMEKAVGLGRQDVVMVLKLARLAGLRIHECTRLKVSHIQDALKEGEVNIKGKGGRVRRVPVDPELRAEFERILDERGGARERKIFVEPGQKTHQVIRSIEKFIRDHRQEFTSRAITPHGLRHSYAREEFERSVDGSKENRCRIKEAKMHVAELLGHGRPEVTDLYLHGGKK